MSMSGNGSLVAAAGKGYVSLIRRGFESPSWTYRKNDLVDSLDMSRDGRYIAIGMEHAAVHYFHVESNVPLWSFRSDGPALCLDMSGDGHLTAVGTFFGALYLLDPLNGAVRWVYRYPRNVSVLALSLSDGGEVLASGASDGTVSLFDAADGRMIVSIKAYGFPYSLSTSSDGRVVAAGGSDAYVYCLNSDEGRLKWSYRAEGPVRSVSTSSDGSLVLAGGYDGGVYMLDAKVGKLVWNHWVKGKVKAVHLSPKGNVAFAGGTDGSLYVFDAETGRLIDSIESDSWVTSISSSLNGLQAVFGSGDKVYLVELKPPLTGEREEFKPFPVYVFQLATPTALTIALLVALTRRGNGWRARRS